MPANEDPPASRSNDKRSVNRLTAKVKSYSLSAKLVSKPALRQRYTP